MAQKSSPQTENPSTPSLALQKVTERRNSRSSKPPSRSDRVRWHLFKQNISPEDIASRENVKLTAVWDSIQRMEAYKNLHSDEEVNMQINAIVIEQAKTVGKVIGRAMQAKHTVTVKSGKVGKERWRSTKVDDHATQLKGVEAFRALVEATRPKGGGVNIAVQNNNGNGGGAATSRERGNTFEERVRRMRERKGITSSDDVVEGEFTTPPSQQSLADEMEEFGLDGFDEGEDEDNEEEGED